MSDTHGSDADRTSAGDTRSPNGRMRTAHEIAQDTMIKTRYERGPDGRFRPRTIAPEQLHPLHPPPGDSTSPYVASAPPPAMSTKPALKSKTVQTGLAGFLITVWDPLVGLAAALFTLLGLEVGTHDWLTYNDDGTISLGEILAVARDIITPLLFLLVVRYRKRAAAWISGWRKTR